ncbi:hypothetical protein LYNGBM3L_66950 [Moorena producens 3L]|uniref:Transposase n=1 Tax=Moorena producens 3L TaxID=489825 RepID=F4Y1U6_9CYAN|nr:hypothetical protein LYNGBM3L_66950 [Moorena producens 3L]
MFALIDPEQFHDFLLRWIEYLTDQLDIKLIYIDGKTSRGSYDRQSKLKA